MATDENVGGGVDRSKLPKSDFVFPEDSPDGGFPIVKAGDVADAVSSWGRYRGKRSFAEFRRRLTAIAKRKGFDLPQKWQDETHNAEAELPTRILRGLEILRTGRWNGRDYTQADLAAIEESFAALRGTYDPPGKLGHSREQALVTSDGLPAVGWVDRVYRRGNRLLADFRDVPARFAKLVEAGAYRKRSAELWFDVTLADRVWPVVLKAVSWLGADSPAVKGMSDVFELYHDQHPEFAVTLVDAADTAALADDSFDRIRAAVQDALDRAYPWPLLEGCAPYRDLEEPSNVIRELFADRVIVTDCDGDELFAIPYTVDAAGEVTLGEPVPVKAAYVPVPEEKPELTETKQPEIAGARRVETMQDSEIRTVLGLAADADVRAALIELKATSVTLTDHQATEKALAEARHELATRDAVEIVDQAVRSGKLVPKQAEWAKAYCLSDRAGFEAFVAAAPLAVHLGEIGSGGDAGAARELTAAERLVAEKMGISEERLADRRPLATKLAERRQAASAKTQ